MFKRSPWWIFIVGAVICAVMSVVTAIEYANERAVVRASLSNPPEPVSLSALPEASQASIFGEIAVRDIAGSRTGTISTGGEGEVFLLLSSATTPPVYLALVDVADEREVFERENDLIRAEGADRVVRAILIEDPDTRADLIDLIAEDIPSVRDHPFLLAEYLYGDREAALSERVQDALFDFLLMVASFLALTAMSLYKYLEWRRSEGSADKAA